MITSDLFTNNSSALFENTGPVTHRVGLTVTDPNHPMVSKRGETIQKTVRVKGDDREKAINGAIAHLRRKGYKVHDHHYIGTVDQGVSEGQLELNTPDPVVVVQDQQGKILDKINLSVAAQKYKLGQPQNIKNQLAHQNYTKIGSYTIVSPMSGQPQDQTTTGQKTTFATPGVVEDMPHGQDINDPLDPSYGGNRNRSVKQNIQARLGHDERGDARERAGQPRSTHARHKPQLPESSMDDDAIWRQYGQYNAQDLMQEFPNLNPKDAQTIVNYAEYGWSSSNPQKFRNEVVQRVKMAMGQQGVNEVSLGDYRKKAQLSQAGAKINKFFDRDDPAAVAAADQTIAKREKGLARADARIKPYTPPAQDAEKHQRDLTAKYPNIDELVAAAEQRRDPNYDYAEGDAYYRGREAEQNYQKLKQIQRVIQGLNESCAAVKKNYLYEGLDRDSVNTVKLWESAGQRIVEAQLTVDQINQLFKSAEQDATAAGGNRTMVGKGKDAAVAVNRAWEDLKTKVQNSGPIKSVDAAYDSAAEKLKQATGGDQGVMKYVQKYRDFAKAHPVAQSLIYSALIAAAGISGAGVGGAAALGLFKLVDKLLQGEKFSSAAYSGAKTGAMAYGASKVADYFRGPQTPQGGGGLDPKDPDVAAFRRDVADMRGYDNYMTKNPTSSLSPEQYAAKIGKASALTPDGSGLTSQASMMNNIASKMGLPPGAHQATFQGGVPVTIDGKAVPLNLLSGDQQRNIEAARAMRQAMSGSQSLAQKAAAAAAAADKTYESLNVHTSHKLTDADLYFIFSAATQLNEGIWDSIKGTAGKAAGKAADWAKTQGTNLTTKVTADKLKSAWLKAGSPTDSDQVYNVMTQAGVAPQILDTVYKTMGVPTFKEKALARPTTPAFSSAPIPAGPASKSAAAAGSAPATTTPASPEVTPNAATPATADAPKTKQLGTGTGRINPATGRPWTPSELKAKYAQPQSTAPTPDSEPPAPELTSPEPALKSSPTAPQSPEEIRKAKQSAAALAAQQAMGDVASPAPAPTVASTPAPASSAAPSGPPGFNAGNLAQLPGMAQYMQQKPAAAKPAPNFARGPAAYGKTTMNVGPTATKPTATAAPAGKKPTAQQQQEYYKSLGLAESLTWSQNFDPGRSLYRRMKQDI